MSGLTLFLAIVAGVLAPSCALVYLVVRWRDRKLRSRLPTINHQLHGPFRRRR